MNWLHYFAFVLGSAILICLVGFLYEWMSRRYR